MTELKTLNDIENYWDGDIPKIITAEIRQEAIKWINTAIGLLGRKQGIDTNLNLMTFLNITEEDLK